MKFFFVAPQHGRAGGDARLGQQVVQVDDLGGRCGVREGQRVGCASPPALSSSLPLTHTPHSHLVARFVAHDDKHGALPGGDPILDEGADLGWEEEKRESVSAAVAVFLCLPILQPDRRPDRCERH